MEKNHDKIRWTVAFILIAVLLLGMAGMYVKLFQPSKPAASTANKPVQSGFVLSETEESGIMLMSANVAEEDFAAYGVSPLSESAVTLTVTVTPTEATYPQVDWTVSFASGSGWASGKNISDYVTVTPSSDGALTATAECKQPFGEQVVITVKSRKNPEALASCTCNYVKRVDSMTVKLMKGGATTTTIALGDGLTYTASVQPNYTAGTLTPQISATYALDLDGSYWSKGNTSNTAGFMYGVNVSSYQFSSTFVSTQDLVFELATPNGGMKWTNAQMLNNFITCVNKRLPDNNQAILTATYTVTYQGTELSTGTGKLNLSFDVSNLEVAVSDVNVDTTTITW